MSLPSAPRSHHQTLAVDPWSFRDLRTDLALLCHGLFQIRAVFPCFGRGSGLELLPADREGEGMCSTRTGVRYVLPVALFLRCLIPGPPLPPPWQIEREGKDVTITAFSKMVGYALQVCRNSLGSCFFLEKIYMGL